MGGAGGSCKGGREQGGGWGEEQEGGLVSVA